MAKFQCKSCAGQVVNFAYVGDIQLDKDGFFEIDETKHAKLVEDLKTCKGYQFILEAKKKVEPPKTAPVEPKKVEPPAPVKEVPPVVQVEEPKKEQVEKPNA